jgi:TolB-like protein/tetratricopeptide (TPR) repeat protein
MALIAMASVLARSDGAGAGTELATAPGASEVTSVAVLPFVDMSPDRDQEHLADGIAEEILHTLARIREIRVAARTSSFFFKGQNVPVREIAERLGVDHVLEGSVRVSGGQLRITAQLVDARSDRHLWSATFDPADGNVFAVHEEIAHTVADALRAELRLPPGGGPRTVDPSPEAHELYLRGLFHWNRRSAPDLLLAIRFFEEAVELDPEHARAWAGLALVHAIIPIGFTPLLPTAEARARLEVAADRALALDSTLAEVHAARAISYHFEWRWEDAEREFQRALALNPRHATTHQWYGEHQAKTGRGEAGVASMRRALELDPLSLVIQNDLGVAFLLDRRYVEAREVWTRTLETDPTFVLPHYFLHRLHLMEGRLDEAEESGRRWAALSGAYPVEDLVTLTRAFGAPELRGRALAILDQWEARASPRWLDLAFYRLYLGAPDEAARSLERGVAAGEPMVAQIGYAPWLDPLRGDPRYEALVRELGFP